jgi:hypothetical protein
VSLAKFSTVRAVKPAMFVGSAIMALPSQVVVVWLARFLTALHVLQLLVAVYVLVSINPTPQGIVCSVRLLARRAIVMVLVLLVFNLSILILRMVVVSPAKTRIVQSVNQMQ